MPSFFEDDGLNESQPLSAIPDFDPCYQADVPTAEEAAQESSALLEALTESDHADTGEDAGQ